MSSSSERRLFIVEVVRDPKNHGAVRGYRERRGGPRVASIRDLAAGAMFRSEYDGREGWMIVLPGSAIWHTEMRTADGQPWEVTGEAPKLTVTPSINVVGVWHGWIRDGVLVDA